MVIGGDEGRQPTISPEVFSLRVDVDSSKIIMHESIADDSINVDPPEIGCARILLKRVLIG
jgi:hypothetical protein